MPEIPDLTDPRYLDEVGWFLYHEKYRRDHFGGSYDAERLAHSRLLLEEVVRHLGRDARWTESKTIVSLGCGCTGDLAAFPAAVKIAIDPLLYVYQQLGMLVKDEAGSRTVHDEPTVFSVESLCHLLKERFEVLTLVDNHPPHSRGRLCSVRVVAHKQPRASHLLDKDKILQAYEARLR